MGRIIPALYVSTLLKSVCDYDGLGFSPCVCSIIGFPRRILLLELKFIVHFSLISALISAKWGVVCILCLLPKKLVYLGLTRLYFLACSLYSRK